MIFQIINFLSNLLLAADSTATSTKPVSTTDKQITKGTTPEKKTESTSGKDGQSPAPADNSEKNDKVDKNEDVKEKDGQKKDDKEKDEKKKEGDTDGTSNTVCLECGDFPTEVKCEECDSDCAKKCGCKCGDNEVRYVKNLEDISCDCIRDYQEKHNITLKPLETVSNCNDTGSSKSLLN